MQTASPSHLMLVPRASYGPTTKLLHDRAVRPCHAGRERVLAGRQLRVVDRQLIVVRHGQIRRRLALHRTSRHRLPGAVVEAAFGDRAVGGIVTVEEETPGGGLVRRLPERLPLALPIHARLAAGTVRPAAQGCDPGTCQGREERAPIDHEFCPRSSSWSVFKGLLTAGRRRGSCGCRRPRQSRCPGWPGT